MFKGKKKKEEFKKIDPEENNEEFDAGSQEEEYTESKEPKVLIKIVKEYPMAPVTEGKDANGNIIKLITIEEYLTQQANS